MHAPVADWSARWATPRGRIEVKDLEWNALEWIAFNLRAEDQRELYGNLPYDTPLHLAGMVMHGTAQNKGVGWIWWLGGRPVAALGAMQNFPGNWQVWSFGTDDYAVAVPFMRERWHKLVEHAARNGCHRLECKSHSCHKESHRLLKILGADHVTLRGYGRDRADYLYFYWLLAPPVNS